MFLIFVELRCSENAEVIEILHLVRLVVEFAADELRLILMIFCVLKEVLAAFYRGDW